jgi:plastocyanin
MHYSRPLALIVLVAATACGGSESTTPAAKVVARITVSGGSTTLDIGQTTALSAAAFEASGAQITSPGVITWTSSATTVAAVDQTGKVTAVAAGTTTVAANVAGVSGSLAIKVNPAAVATKDSIFTIGQTAFSPDPLPVAVGATVIFVLGYDGIGHDVRFATKAGAPADIPVTVHQPIARTFSTAGDFSYFCPTHPQMTGVVSVR